MKNTCYTLLNGGRVLLTHDIAYDITTESDVIHVGPFPINNDVSLPLAYKIRNALSEIYPYTTNIMDETLLWEEQTWSHRLKITIGLLLIEIIDENNQLMIHFHTEMSEITENQWAIVHWLITHKKELSFFVKGMHNAAHLNLSWSQFQKAIIKGSQESLELCTALNEIIPCGLMEYMLNQKELTHETGIYL